jgi:anti-sigma regulatory factor (Ser/Thr protein kinase)
LPRKPAAVPAARAFVGRALRSAGVPRGVADGLVQAVAEACNNAILHAAGETFSVSVKVQGTACTLIISDLGRGFEPPEHVRMPSPEAVDHRGLALMEALVDQVKVSSTPAGTTVVLVHEAPSVPNGGSPPTSSLGRVTRLVAGE